MTDRAGEQNRPAPKRHGFGVAASPLNGVKLDLGLIMVCGFVLLLLQGYLNVPEAVRIALLLGYGVAGMLWLVVRTRRVVRATERERNGT